MKKLGAILACVLLTLVLVMPGAAVQTKATVDPTAAPLAQNYVGADFRGGEIAYQLDAPIDRSVNTFAACIRLERSAYTVKKGGVIFGNYHANNANSTNNRYSNLGVNEQGNVYLDWTKTRYVFDKVDVRTGEWLHLAVVRDKAAGKLLLYVNGALAQTLDTCPTSETDGNWFCHRIGGDLTEDETKYPFWGEIGHVACYASARTAQEIADDSRDVSAVSYFTRGEDLLYASMLTLGDEIVTDRSACFNTARLVTNDLFYKKDLYEVGDYSLAAIGDTQRIAESGAASCTHISEWLIDNVDTRKIGMTVYLGDTTGAYVGTSTEHWDDMLTVIRDATAMLDGKVPYHVIPGNHDYNEKSTWRDLDKFNDYFNSDRLATPFNGYAGAYEVGKTQNTYYTATLGGVKYLFLALEFGPDADMMRWACEVLAAHPDHRAVVSTHGFLDAAGKLYEDGDYGSADQYWSLYNRDVDATSSGEMWDRYLSKHENVFMILCGHSTTESVAYKTLVGEHGNTAMVFRIDPSYIISYAKGLDSIIGLFQFHEATSTVTFNYFSARKQELYNVQNQMSINFSTFTRLTHSYYTEGGIVR